MGCTQTKVRLTWWRKAHMDRVLNSTYSSFGGSTPRTPLNGLGHCSSDRSEKDQANEENQEYAATMLFLSKVPLFKRLPRDQHPILASACEPVQFSAKSFVIRHGEEGSEFFVIRSGEANVIAADGSKVNVLKEGDYFGEHALLHNEPRSASVQAVTALCALKITRDKFQSLKLNERLQFGNRKAVGGGGGGGEKTRKPPTRKTPAEREAIATAIKGNQNLQVIASLSEERMKQLADVAWEEKVEKGRQLITEGDLPADYFYIVKSGGFEYWIANKPGSTEASPKATLRHSRQVGSAGPGGSFGELALMYAAPRAATVLATQDSVVWVIDRSDFKNILMKVSEDKVAEYEEYLQSVDVLSTLRHEERRALAEVMMEMHFVQGEVVIRQGEPGTTFYILCEGEAAVVKDGVEQVRLRGFPSGTKAQFFGERALLNREPRAATVTITSLYAKALVLDQESFNLILGPLEDIFKRRARVPSTCWGCWDCVHTGLVSMKMHRAGGRRQLAIAAQREQQVKAMARVDAEAQRVAAATGIAPDGTKPRVRRHDLRRIGVLGCGAFGTVELWEHKQTKDTFAMKGISKGFIVKSGMQESVMTERFILMMTNSKFIISLFETYNGTQTLYFLLEPALGGELHTTYIKQCFYGKAGHARYYAACVVYAFEHLHERHIIYRDLKPENLLLNAEGHLKVTDMGLSKFVIGKTYTTCGTPDYFAPELIQSIGHTSAVDWWGLGILLFELMTGHPPFEAESHMEIYSRVLKGIDCVSMPAAIDSALANLLKAILRKEPAERLPVRTGGTKNLKAHKWYSGFDWATLFALTMVPPYHPTVKSKADISNFNVRPEDLPQFFPYVDDGSGWDKEFATA